MKSRPSRGASPSVSRKRLCVFKGYLNKKLVGESVAEFSYQPNKCGAGSINIEARISVGQYKRPRGRPLKQLRARN